MNHYRGGCLCGGVRYAIDGEIGRVTLCHCAECRKAQGGAHVVAAPVASAAFRLTQGAELLAAWESSPGKERVFCSRCGSPLFSRRAADPASLRLRIGSLDTPLGRRPDAHIWVSDKADWDLIEDSIPQNERLEPGA